MIPEQQLNLTRRPATVLSGATPTEKHGDHRKMFYDLKFECLLDIQEINLLLQTPGDPNPAQYLFDLKDDGHPLNLPDLDIVGELRKDIRGDFVVQVGKKKLEYGDAHTVGSANKVTFITGGHAKLVMNVRIDPGVADYPAIKEAVETQNVTVSFVEYAESASAKGKNEDQAEMTV